MWTVAFGSHSVARDTSQGIAVQQQVRTVPIMGEGGKTPTARTRSTAKSTSKHKGKLNVSLSRGIDRRHGHRNRVQVSRTPGE